MARGATEAASGAMKDGLMQARPQGACVGARYGAWLGVMDAVMDATIGSAQQAESDIVTYTACVTPRQAALEAQSIRAGDTA